MYTYLSNFSLQKINSMHVGIKSLTFIPVPFMSKTGTEWPQSMWYDYFKGKQSVKIRKTFLHVFWMRKKKIN